MDVYTVAFPFRLHRMMCVWFNCPMRFFRCLNFLSLSTLTDPSRAPLSLHFTLLPYLRYTILPGPTLDLFHRFELSLRLPWGVTMAAEARKAYVNFMNGTSGSNNSMQQQPQQGQGQWQQPDLHLQHQYAAYAQMQQMQQQQQQGQGQGQQRLQNPYATQQYPPTANPVYVLQSICSPPLFKSRAALYHKISMTNPPTRS